MSMNRTATGPAVEPRIQALTGETLGELLDLAAVRTPSSIALVIRRGMIDERWTYRQVSERSDRVAQRLRRAGVEPGDRVVTWSQNDPWLVAAYFAIWKLGAAIVPLDMRMQTDVAVRIGTRTEPRLLLAGEGVDPDAAERLGVPILSLDEPSLDPIEGRTGPMLSLPEVRPSDVAEVICTSGTTSDPKGVVLTHGQIVHVVRMFAQTVTGGEPDRILGSIPLTHMYAQTLLLMTGFVDGSTLVFLHSLMPKAVKATMQREQITVLTLTPHLIRLRLQAIESEARRTGREKQLQVMGRIARRLPIRCRRLLFRSLLQRAGGALSVIGSGSARLDPELQEAWETFGVRVVQGYGTTECPAIAAHTRRSRTVGTVGPPLPGLEVRIADDNELLVRGPCVMSGYWNAPEATAEVLDVDGWLHTGDAARIDDAGEIVLLGRTRDRIALPSGLNVYPEDVESALLATGAVRAAVVFESTPGHLTAALVPVENEADDSTLDAAVREANHALASHQRVGSWRRWPEEDFPRTHTQKIRRGPVQEWFAQETTAGADAAPAASAVPQGQPAGSTGAEVPVDGLAQLVAAVLAESSGGRTPEVSASTTIESLELDSLTAVSLALRIDEAFEAALSDDEVLEAHDVAQLRELVLQRQGQPPAPPWSRWAFGEPARLVRRVLDASLTGCAIGIVAGPEVKGGAHLDGLEGPVLVCANHTSHLDAPIVRAALPQGLRDRAAIAAAADVWFDGSPLGPPSELAFGAIPFGRTADVRASLERVGDLVNDGFSVIIFPEGTRSADGQVLPMREGIGLLARGLRVPVVPAHIDGAHEILPKGTWLPSHRHRTRVTVRFGAPLRFGPDATVRQITAQVGRAIEELGRARG